MKAIIFAAAFAAVSSSVAAAPITYPWSDLIVFGDSLSDAGNLGGVATNGTTWAGQLGAAPALAGGTNFAFLGATAVSNADPFLDFTEQRALFAGAGLTLGSNPLVVAWFGGNDLLNATDPSAIGNAVTQIAAGVASLAGMGLTRFVLPGLPDLGLIPRNLGNPVASAMATFASNAFNDALQGVIGAANASGLDVTYLDVNGIFAEILGDPASFGFTNVTDTCERGAISCDGYVFWDDIHPTAATHAILAERLRLAAEPAVVPLPATGLLLLAAFGGLGLLRRRAA